MPQVSEIQYTIELIFQTLSLIISALVVLSHLVKFSWGARSKLMPFFHSYKNVPPLLNRCFTQCHYHHLLMRFNQPQCMSRAKKGDNQVVQITNIHLNLYPRGTFRTETDD